MTPPAPECIAPLGVASVTKHYYLVALTAKGWFICGWVWQFLEVVLIRSVPYVHFGHEGLSTKLTVNPITRMTLVVVKAAERHAPMVPMATVPSVVPVIS